MPSVTIPAQDEDSRQKNLTSDLNRALFNRWAAEQPHSNVEDLYASFVRRREEIWEQRPLESALIQVGEWLIEPEWQQGPYLKVAQGDLQGARAEVEERWELYANLLVEQHEVTQESVLIHAFLKTAIEQWLEAFDLIEQGQDEEAAPLVESASRRLAALVAYGDHLDRQTTTTGASYDA